MPDAAPRPIDTHCHLDMPQFAGDREAVIARALDSLDALITVGTDIESCEAALAIASAHHGRIFCALGVHPHDARRLDQGALERLRELAARPEVVAIGETGLDYHYDHSPREVQRRAMERHLALAMELELPAVIHSREAQDDTLSILRASGLRQGVMHCFSGDLAMAQEVMAMGLHISIAGPVTFPKSLSLKDVARDVPDDRLLLETDAPYLTPVPHRGKRNEPAYVLHTAAAVAALRGISEADIARITTLNARRLFSLPASSEASAEGGEIAYRIRESLYLNLTNRCTNRCSFCARFFSDYVKGHNLRLKEDPPVEALRAAIGDPARFREVVFCGYGEPMLRLDAVKELAAYVKGRSGTVRINTNGHANRIHQRNVLPELAGLVDVISISLNAQDAETYDRLCHPDFEGAFDEVVAFIKEARWHIPRVDVTVVRQPGVDIEACAALARAWGVTLRIRHLDSVG